MVDIDVNTSRGDCNVTLPWSSESSFSETTDFRNITSNNIPNHAVGLFGQVPGSLNPNAIAPQTSSYQIALTPQKASTITMLQGSNGPMYSFGIFFNGVELDPEAAEPWPHPQGPPPWENVNWDWNLNASMAGFAKVGDSGFGLDCNNAHVQGCFGHAECGPDDPGGMYHYHGLPTGLISKLNDSLVGYAGDGFEIHYLKNQKSSR